MRTTEGASRTGLPSAVPLLAAALATAFACARGEADGGGDPNGRGAGPTADRQDGQALYEAQCRSCHGARGEGGRGPALRDWSRGEEALVTTIDRTMPLGAPERCVGACAESVAKYILERFRGEIVCGSPEPSQRMLRLLTRREYRATIEDLFGAGVAPRPEREPPPPSCPPPTFRFDPRGRPLRTVHVAGSFNGWPQTIAGGGWPLAANGGVYVLTRALPRGTHAYKFVLDEAEWVVDPANPRRERDGAGNENSILEVPCDSGGNGGSQDAGNGGGGAAALATALTNALGTFARETRPEGFFFDDHGPGRVVAGEQGEAFVRAAEAIARAVTLPEVTSCSGGDRGACADAFLERVGRRVFRRPLTGGERARYRAAIVGGADHVSGARRALAGMLASPGFLYRSELGERREDGTYALTTYELASLLSYTFWGTLPDDALFAAASSGELASKEALEREARRLLASPRARPMLRTFAEQWLGIETVTEVDKNRDLYPGFDDELRAAMREETTRFFEHVALDGSHRVEELFKADYTFASARLSRHYGIAGVSATTPVRVPYPDALRAGVLGHGSVLATTGHSDQTSPIRRGLFVRSRLLCQEFPPPPPNAGGVPKVDPNATTRTRFAQHTENAFCKSCHQYIDDIGFGFERFDTVGRLRTEEAGRPVDSRGDMNDVEGLGTKTRAPFATLRELGETLAKSEAAKTCIARQYYRFARGVLDDDICSTADLRARFAASGHDLRELFVGVVLAPDFGVRR